MKILKKLATVFFAATVSALILYADILFSFPAQITMYRGQNHSKNMGSGVFIGSISSDMNVSSSGENVTPLETGTYDATLSALKTIPFKSIKINVTEPSYLYASGELIGLRIHNKGLIVIDTSPIETNDNLSSPAENAGLEAGDVILEINGIAVQSSGDVPLLLKTGESVLTVNRNNRIIKLKITPVTDKNDSRPKLGVWVRDSTAGVGTMTYYNPETNSFGSLGHSISDSDTGIMFDILKGTIEKSYVVSLRKGEKGSPGEICGGFSGGNIAGNLLKNCEAGVYGVLTENADISGTLLPTAPMNQVKTGKAHILSTVDSSIKKYEIEILRTMPFGSAAKGLVIKITDPDLLKKTGGIIQGMSGSPIIQNGKLIGAVTHVLINDPTRGYGIFIENMLSEAEKIK
ncbi:MAG: SpoIVB peptidase [Clostridia bacterium]|nr:SpoIVB peptidase [Clostridia bacterium]